VIRAGLVATILVLTAGCTLFGDDTRGFTIPSSAMEPTLRCAKPGTGCSADENDKIRTREVDELVRGDIIVFDTPAKVRPQCGAGGIFVKRIIGLPDETWAMQDGFVFVNGKRLDEPYIESDRRDRESYPPQKIPQDSYFVMGDNRTQSCDSRRWGSLPRENVIGKVVEIERG
jgi:signal peptidase I